MGHKTRTAILLAGAFALVSPANTDNAPTAAPEPVIQRDTTPKGALACIGQADISAARAGRVELTGLKGALYQAFEIRSKWYAPSLLENVQFCTKTFKASSCGGRINGVIDTPDFEGDTWNVLINEELLREEAEAKDGKLIAGLVTAHEVFHLRQRGLGINPYVIGNYAPEERGRMKWLMEADARARPILQAYINGDNIALDNLRDRPSYREMVTAFEETIAAKPDNFAAAMVAAVIAFRERPRSALGQDYFLVKRLDAKNIGFNPNAAQSRFFDDAAFNNPRSPAQKLGRLEDGMGNYMRDPALWAYINQSVTSQDMEVALRAYAAGEKLCSEEDSQRIMMTSLELEASKAPPAEFFTASFSQP